jgi:hypothetical protein
MWNKSAISHCPLRVVRTVCTWRGRQIDYMRRGEKGGSQATYGKISLGGLVTRFASMMPTAFHELDFGCPLATLSINKRLHQQQTDFKRCLDQEIPEACPPPTYPVAEVVFSRESWPLSP